jgi:hypothetical protein
VSRRWAIWGGIAVAVAVVLVVVGRAEREHHADVQNARIARVVSAVGAIGGPSLDAYRVRSEYACLLYKRGANPYALELCIDHAGGVIEAIDRRGGTPYIGSVREDRALAHHHVAGGWVAVERLLKKMDAEAVGTVACCS